MGDDDPVARLRAEMDQAREGMKELARNVYAFYAASSEAGFTDEQAFDLTREWVREMVRGTFGGES